MSDAAGFWRWFSEHAKGLTWPPEREWVEEIGEQLHAIDDGLAFELWKDQAIKLSISASGDPDLFDAVEALVAAAPSFTQLKVVAFRQRGPVAEATLQLPDGMELSADDIWFRLVTAGDPVDLDLFVRGLPDENPGELQEAVYILLDNALGEYDVVKHIGGIDWHALPADPKRAGLSPLSELPVKFDLALQRPLKN